MGGILAQAHGPKPVRDAQLQGPGGAIVAVNHQNLIPDFATLSLVYVERCEDAQVARLKGGVPLP